MNRTSVVVLVLMVVLGGVLVGWQEMFGDGRVSTTAHSTVQNIQHLANELKQQPLSVAMPAPLTRAHARVEELDDCQQCHSWLHGVPDSRCLRCHEVVGERSATRTGFHGRLTGACVTCHADHEPQIVELDREAFNHALARYALEGEHLRVTCEGCHEVQVEGPRADSRMSYLELSHERCADCHTDPHAEQFTGTSCETCHAVQGFRAEALTFQHSELASFSLTGRHRDVECAACHGLQAGAEVVLFRGLATSCVACHEDPHEGSTTSRDCASCHSSEGWRGEALAFDHQAGRFPLDATHGGLDCVSCHTADLIFAPLPTTCAGCHEEIAGHLAGGLSTSELWSNGDRPWRPSPHAGLVACAECHPPSATSQDASAYAQRCAGCHNPRYAELFLDRGAHLRTLELQARAGADERTRAALTALLRAGNHNYTEAEQRLRTLSRR